MAQGKFVSYLRVSTQRQGKSGLGLEAQRKAVSDYLNGGDWQLVKELVEVETGKSKERPKLAAALRLCRIYNARLLVAKLDRLARNVAFISALMEAGVHFVAVDLPQANELTVHILASVAQYEARAISERTIVALAAAKAKGKPLGGVRELKKQKGQYWNLASVSDKGRAVAMKVRQDAMKKCNDDLLPLIEAIKSEGATSLRQIATVLNERGTLTARDYHLQAKRKHQGTSVQMQSPTERRYEWTAAQVQRVLKSRPA